MVLSPSLDSQLSVLLHCLSPPPALPSSPSWSAYTSVLHIPSRPLAADCVPFQCTSDLYLFPSHQTVVSWGQRGKRAKAKVCAEEAALKEEH